MEQSEEQLAELRELAASPNTPPDVAARARMVLLRRRGLTRGEVAAQCGVSLQTFDRWMARFTEYGAAGLASRPRARPQAPDHARAHALELAAAPPPLSTGLTHWTTRALADHLRQTDGITVSHNYIATVLRQAGIDLTPPPTVRKSRRSEPLEVEYEFVVVDGPHARALQQHQTEALLAALRWLRENPTETE